MSELRDLIVSLNFDDIDIKKLLAVDSAMDEIEDKFNTMDRNIKESGRGFSKLGATGGGALNEIRGEADDAGDAINDISRDAKRTGDALDDLGDEGKGAATAINVFFGDVEKNFKDLERDIGRTGNKFIGMGAKAEIAAGSAEDAVEDVGDEVEDVAIKLGVMGAMSSLVFGTMKGDIIGTTFASKILGSQILLLTGKVAVMGAAFVLAFSLATAAGAPLLAFSMALVSSLAVAAIGVGAFGAVAVGVFVELYKTQEDLGKLQEKIAKEDDPKKKAKLQQDLADAYANMSKEQRGALEGISEFKGFWSDFTKQFEKPIFAAFGQGLGAATGLLKGLEPTITAVSGVVVELMTELNKDIAGGGFKSFFEWLETNGAESLYNFAHIGGNLLGGFFGILQAFAPLGASFEESLLGMTQRFQEWGETLSESTAFQEFLSYAQTNGPVFIEFMGNLWAIIGDVVEAFKPLGTIVLQAFADITGKVSELTPGLEEIIEKAIAFGGEIVDNWPLISETLIGVGTAVTVFVGIMKGMTIVSVITTLFAAWRTGTLLQTAAMMGLNLALLANPITWVVVAIASLIAIGVVLYRNWDTVRDKTQQLWDKLGAAQGVVTLALGPIGFLIRAAVTLADNWDNTKGVWENVWNGIKISASNAVNDVIGSINALIGMINQIPGVSIPIIPKVDWGAARALSGTSSSSGSARSVGGPVMSHATGLERVPYDNYGANLHKDEAVLTARQSDALRAAGILGRNGSKPTLEIGQTMANTGNGINKTTNTFAPQVTIQIEPGTNGNIDATSIAQAVKKEMEKFWMQMNLKEA